MVSEEEYQAQCDGEAEYEAEQMAMEGEAAAAEAEISRVDGKPKPIPSFEDMKEWAEDSYKLDLHELMIYVTDISKLYNLSGMSKINLLNITIAGVLSNFFQNKLFPMTEPEVDTSKWVIIKMLFPELGDGHVSILKWNNMLSPTSEPYFHSIPAETFADIQSSAKLLLERHESGRQTFSEVEIAHWKSIVDGNVPYGYRIIKDDVKPTSSE